MDSGNGNTAVVKWKPRQVVLATLFVVGLLLALVLLYRLSSVVLMLFVAILLGTGIKPGVIFLAERGIPRVYGQILIYASLLIIFWGFIFLALPQFVEQSTAVSRLTRTYYNDVRRIMVNSQSTILRNLGVKLSPNLDVQDLTTPPPSDTQTPPDATTKTADAVALVFKYAGILARAIFFIVAVSLMAFYWTLESERAILTLLLLFSSKKRENIRSVIDAIEGKLGAYLFGEGILLVAIGLMSLVAFLIIRLPNALVLAIIAGLMEAVPTVGPILGAIPAILVAASTDPQKIIWVIVSASVIQLLENNLLVPRVMDRSVGVNPLLTILSIAALSSLIGLPGALLAVPIAAIVQLLINRFVITPLREPELKPEGRDYLSYLRLQVQEVAYDTRKNITAEKEGVEEDREEERLEEKIEALANELDQILSQVPLAIDAQEAAR